jgi:hypothetical protein
MLGFLLKNSEKLLFLTGKKKENTTISIKCCLPKYKGFTIKPVYFKLEIGCFYISHQKGE